jgi:nucleoside-diphosphate-sugar epimerase
MAGPRAVTLLELANEIAACVGVPPTRLKLPVMPVSVACHVLELTFRAMNKEAPFSRRSLKFYTGNTAFRTNKAAEVLNYQAETDLSEGLRKTFAVIGTQLQ